MADIQQGGGGGKDGKVRSKKASTRVDMTPMVDLGFLLITFFILATTLSKPKAMTLNVPDKQNKEEQKTDPIKASKVLTLYLGNDNIVHVLDGIAPDDEKAKTEMKDVSFQEVRTAILKSKQRINSQNPKDDKGNEPFVCVIKPLPGSTYKNMVDALDEMKITKTSRYAMVDLLLQADKDLLGDKIKDNDQK
ncbi:MAG: biopolymer transporter ExbD [Spirosomaceae bacterium]|jgi:biopolymer transport protein ExbD|nr:biopolymer transporter ExbD [Spirosomataceae bacterium]